MDEVKFGTSGLRGKVIALTAPVCQAYIKAFLQLLQEKRQLGAQGCLLLGMDLRPSSPFIAAFVVEVVRHFGINIENCGFLPTPALALAAISRRCPAIMVTGSHIPADRNGLKFYTPEGEIDKQDEEIICQNIKFIPTDVDDISLPLPSMTAIEAYRKRTVSILPKGALRGMRIGIYQQSCVARDLLGEVLSQLGAHIVPYGRSKLFRPIDTEALDEETKNSAAEMAKLHQLDAIVSTDGDGDRPLIAGRDGIYLRGDVVGLLCGQFLQADCVITPVTSSSMIERAHLFKQVYRCRVGSPYVLAEMSRAKTQDFQLILGFEANGGVLLGSDVMLEHGCVLPALATRDALLPILAVLGLAQRQGLSIDELASILPSRFSASDRLENIPLKSSKHFIEKLANEGSMRHDFCQKFGLLQAQDRIDGLRLVMENGDILHYRASGNAPELRCYSEASERGAAEILVRKGLVFAKQHL